jgi:hypothetical protein
MDMYKLSHEYYFDAMNTLAVKAIAAAGGKLRPGGKKR